MGVLIFPTQPYHDATAMFITGIIRVFFLKLEYIYGCLNISHTTQHLCFDDVVVYFYMNRWMYVDPDGGCSLHST